MDIYLLRLILLLASIVANIFFGLVPLQIFHTLKKTTVKGATNRSKQLSLIVCLMDSFSAGVLLTTCVLSMIPEIQLHFKNLMDHRFWTVHYPLPEFLICSGFFLVYFCEELILIIVQGKPPKRTKSKTTVTFLEVTECTKPMLQPSDETNSPQCLNQPSENLQPKIKSRVSSTRKHSPLIRSVILFFSLALHSFLEGLSYGLRRKQKVLVNFFLITSTHQCVLAFAFGTQLARTHLNHKKLVVVAVVLLSFATPLGALCGLSLGQSSSSEALKETMVLIFEALSAGSFLYVVFFEIVFNERNNEHNNFVKLFAMFVGFLVVAAIILGHLSEFKAGNEIHDLHQRL